MNPQFNNSYYLNSGYIQYSFSNFLYGKSVYLRIVYNHCYLFYHKVHKSGIIFRKNIDVHKRELYNKNERFTKENCK